MHQGGSPQAHAALCVSGRCEGGVGRGLGLLPLRHKGGEGREGGREGGKEEKGGKEGGSALSGALHDGRTLVRLGRCVCY